MKCLIFRRSSLKKMTIFFTTLHCVVFLVTATTIHTCSVAWCNYAHNSIHPFPVNGGITNILSDTDISDNVLKVNWPYFADVAINGTHTQWSVNLINCTGDQHRSSAGSVSNCSLDLPNNREFSWNYLLNARIALEKCSYC